MLKPPFHKWEMWYWVFVMCYASHKPVVIYLIEPLMELGVTYTRTAQIIK
jgi:hypothetical protein